MGNSKNQNLVAEIKEGHEKLSNEIQEVKKLTQEIQETMSTEMKELREMIMKLTEQQTDLEKENNTIETTEKPKEAEYKVFTPESQKDQTCISVPPEIFDEMITNTGFSVSDFCKFGMNVLLVFTNTVGCLFCQGTLQDIYDLKEELNKLNTVPIIVFEEDDTLLKKFFDLNKFNKPFRSLPRIKSTEKIRQIFQQRSVPEFGAAVENVKAFSGPEYGRLENLGFAMMRDKFQTDRTVNLLVGTFLVKDNKVISQCHQDEFYDRLDLTKIAIDINGTEIEVSNSIFEVNPMDKIDLKKQIFGNDFVEKGKQKLSSWKQTSMKVLTTMDTENEKTPQITVKDCLENPKYLKYFKSYAASEYSSENIIFYEESTKYLSIEKFEAREIRAKFIYETFLTREGEYEINTNAKLINEVKQKISEKDFPKELFSKIWDDLYSSVFRDIYLRFVHSSFKLFHI
eukprot:gene5242-8853_t